MSTKISELPSATSLTGTEEIPLVQTGTTKKADINAIIGGAVSYCVAKTNTNHNITINTTGSNNATFIPLDVITKYNGDDFTLATSKNVKIASHKIIEISGFINPWGLSQAPTYDLRNCVFYSQKWCKNKNRWNFK